MKLSSWDAIGDAIANVSVKPWLFMLIEGGWFHDQFPQIPTIGFWQSLWLCVLVGILTNPTKYLERKIADHLGLTI